LGATAFQAAHRYYQDSLEIHQRLATADPKDIRAQRGLATFYERLGDVSLKGGNTPAARRAYQDALVIAQHLVAADPQNFVAQTDLFASYYRLGVTAQQAQDHEQALQWLDQGATLLGRLDREGKLKGTAYATWPAKVERERTFGQNVLRTLGSLEAALALPKEQLPHVLAARTLVLARRGAHADAAATAEKLAGLQPAVGDHAYDAACGFAQCAAAAGRPPKPDLAFVERYAARAVALLGQAQAAGFFKDPAHAELLQTDKDLDPLRARADFQKLAAAVGKAVKN
jgi:tetratricopeptide (TPR) repeat protein